VERIPKLLFPRSTVITPNIDEAAQLTGLAVSNVDEMRAAARKLHEMGAKNVVITGGHLERPIDLLSLAGAAGGCEQLEFVSERLRSTATHGTGCAFSTSVAANLALGKQLSDAVVLAKAYVTKAIARAYPLGRGAGPIHHLFRMEEQPRPAQDAIEPKH
jgi:hydroxymethylpyrimidine kinase/phosphomethylpyrimidine kinase